MLGLNFNFIFRMGKNDKKQNWKEHFVNVCVKNQPPPTDDVQLAPFPSPPILLYSKLFFPFLIFFQEKNPKLGAASRRRRANRHERTL